MMDNQGEIRRWNKKNQSKGSSNYDKHLMFISVSEFAVSSDSQRKRDKEDDRRNFTVTYSSYSKGIYHTVFILV